MRAQQLRGLWRRLRTPAPASEPLVLPGHLAAHLPIGSVIRWLSDRSEQGLRMHTPIRGWVPVVSDTANYEVLFTPTPEQRREWR